MHVASASSRYVCETQPTHSATKLQPLPFRQLFPFTFHIPCNDPFLSTSLYLCNEENFVISQSLGFKHFHHSLRDMAPVQLDRTNAAHIQEAIHYWSPLLKQSGIGPTDKFTRLLRGIAACISTRYPSLDTSDLSPHQLLQFYQSVNGDYTQLFSLPPKSLACIYQKLRCSYSLQPATSKDEYTLPSIPALKPDGFVKWSTVQLLLAPSEHALFLQNALSQYEVRDPESGELFPKLLPRQLFPSEPHEEMIRWHQSISDELYREATAAQPNTESKPPRASKHNHNPSHKSGEHNETAASDLIHQAAKFFSNPLSRGLDGRPTLVRHLSRGASYFFGGGGGGGAGGRRHSVHEKPQRRDSGTSAELHEERYEQRHRERATRRKEARETSSESESDSEQDTHTRRRARERERERKSMQHRASQRHRSHEPPMSPRMYPADAQPRKLENRQANHVVNEGFMPTHSPPFAATVQKAKQSSGQSKVKPSAAYFSYFDVPRPSSNDPKPVEKTHRVRELSPSQLREEGSYVSYVSQGEEDEDEGYGKEHGEGDATRRGHAPPPPDEASVGRRPSAKRRGTPVVGVHGRKYVNEVPWKKG